MTNFNQNQLSLIFAQASFTYIIDNVLQKNLPFSSFSKVLMEKSIDCFSIQIPKLDPMFKNQSILQILSKKNANVPSILEKYSLPQIMDIFDQSSQFKDCYWINEVKTIMKNYCWLKFGFKISNLLSLSFPSHLSFPPPLVRSLLEAIISSLHLSQERKQCLSRRISIHQKRNPTMAELLFNHRVWAKCWKIDAKECDCLNLQSTLNIELWNGHISSWHFEPKNPVYYALIKSNMNDVLHPIPKRWSSEFVAALSKWLVDLGKISNPSNFQFVDFLNTKWEDRSLAEMITWILKLGNIVPQSPCCIS